MGTILSMPGYSRSYPDAEPLTPQEIQDFYEEGFDTLLVRLGSVVYNAEDMYPCGCCGTLHAQRIALDDVNNCQDCAEALIECLEHIRIERALLSII